MAYEQLELSPTPPSPEHKPQLPVLPGEKTTEDRIDAYVDQAVGSYRGSTLRLDKQYAELVSHEPKGPTNRTGNKATKRQHKPSKRQQAWGETTPAEDGSWSNLA